MASMVAGSWVSVMDAKQNTTAAKKIGNFLQLDLAGKFPLVCNPQFIRHSNQVFMCGNFSENDRRNLQLFR